MKDSKLRFQRWLNEHGANIAADGIIGPATEAAALKVFSNTSAPAVTPHQIQTIADTLGGSVKQVNAVASVESRGGGYDDFGRPVALFERHKFRLHTYTMYDAQVPDLSNPKPGGYGKSSAQWGRIMRACRFDPDAAFQSASWGKFQVLGEYYDEFGFATVWDFVLSMTKSEFGHYQALASYILMAKLTDEFAALSTNIRGNRLFARGYNGPKYADNAYHLKLAEAMAA